MPSPSCATIPTSGRGRNCCLVLDQFEQWLQGRPIEPSSSWSGRCGNVTAGACRPCSWCATTSGWPLTRLLRAVEVPLVEGANGAAVELFDGRHTPQGARGIRPVAGSACHPASWPPAAKATVFLDRAVQGLTGPDGRVIPVRLSLFVEVVRNRPWTLHTLRALGGMEGIGVKFLEEAFDSALAAPAHRVPPPRGNGRA